MSLIQAWAAPAANAPLELVDMRLGPLRADEVEIEVEHCGLCSADDAIWRNLSGGTKYPFVPGHEVVGRIRDAGAAVPRERIGQRVGVGWLRGSCAHCMSCLGGMQHLCAKRERTVLDQFGGFASRMRAQSDWAVALPGSLDAASAGPLFCAGLAVFRPLLDLPVLPTWRVAVIGVGGLGHLALKFLEAWGCESVAITSDESKAADALRLGASSAIVSTDTAARSALKGTFDLVMVTSRGLDADGAFELLGPRGRMHVLATLPEPLSVRTSTLAGADRSVSGSMVGGPVACMRMLDFAARHGIAPDVERMPMSQANEALRRFASGAARYRIVLDADFAH